MPSDADHHWTQAFSEHQAFLTRLARSLTRDAHAAADVVQDTLLVAHQRGRAPSGSTRSFLAGILRNVAFKARRGEGRRRVHERAAARPEELEAPDDIGEQLEAQRHMLEALERLSDPYRETLVLRYQRELTPSVIAERQGVSLATVKSRLARGLARVREDLDRRYGDRRAWSLALAGVGRPRGGSVVATPLVTGGVIVTMKWILGVAAAALVAGLFLDGDERSEANDVPLAGGDAAASAELADISEANARHAIAPEAGERPVDSRVAADDGEDPPEAPPASASGHVFHVDGSPAAGVALVYRPNFGEEVALETDLSGAFEVPGPLSRGSVFVQEEGLWNLCPGALDAPPDVGHPTVVVARRVATSFGVLDARDAPVARASVSLVLPAGWDSALPVALDGARDPRAWSQADEHGRVDAEFPSVPGARLRVDAGPRFHPAEVELDALLTAGATVTLEDRALPDVVLAGRVVGEDGAPVAGASLCIGRQEARSDEHGCFTFSGELDVGRSLEVLKVGYLPASIEDPTDPVTVHLVSGVLRIAGVVVDESGAALEGRPVTLAGQTFWGVRRGASTAVEDALGGDVGYTDAEGRFELAGLVDREYELVTIDFETLWSRRVEGVRPGTEDLRIVLGPPEDARTVAGRCVAPDGTPIAGISVAPRIVVEQHMRGGPPGPASTHGYVGTRSITSDEGTFELSDLPADVGSLVIESSTILPTDLALDAERDSSDLEIPVERRAAFELEVTGEHAGATGYRVLDAQGELLTIYDFSAHGHSASSHGTLERGKSGIRTVSERASELVLYAGPNIVHRSPVTLVPGEVGRLRVR